MDNSVAVVDDDSTKKKTNNENSFHKKEFWSGKCVPGNYFQKKKIPEKILYNGQQKKVQIKMLMMMTKR